ncbi:MAG: patatin-like phospholipase family protein [Saprospiraceae bacterium]|nr:patatin-like phospholipase family protein [Saprospiraceae bacterium]
MQDIFKEIHIADNQIIKCGLAINAKRADTYSLWTVVNHPDGIYSNANAHLKLWELCRASSAAPYYFKPKKLGLRRRNGEPIEAAFIDGGVSLANNPAWQTFLAATVPSFGFHWKTGQSELFITSIGTGNGLKKEDPDKLVNEKAVTWATKIPDLFMTDALEMNDIIMHVAGKNIGPDYKVDSQFYDLSQISKENQPLFSYQRYNVKLQSDFLQDLGFNYSDEEIKSLKEMDHYENMDKLLEIGKKYGESIMGSFKL